MFKTMVNYTLEISDKPDHPRYLSTLSLVIAAPFVLSPLVGFLADLNMQLVMIGGSVVIATGGLLTFSLSEPRHRVHSDIAELAENALDVTTPD